LCFIKKKTHTYHIHHLQPQIQFNQKFNSIIFKHTTHHNSHHSLFLLPSSFFSTSLTLTFPTLATIQFQFPITLTDSIHLDGCIRKQASRTIIIPSCMKYIRVWLDVFKHTNIIYFTHNHFFIQTSFLKLQMVIKT